MKKWRKILLIIVLSVLLLLIAVLYATPRVARSYIEDNSKELLGRRIEIERIRLNYFTLTLKIDGFILYEADDREVFVSFDKFRVDLKLIPTLKGNYTISSLLLDNFKVNMEFDGEHFNFDDMVVEADTTVSQEPIDTVPSEPVRFSLNNIVIRNGNFSYYDSKEDIHHKLSNIGFKVPAFSWDGEDASELGLNFVFEPQGKLNLKANVDYPSQRYDLNIKVIDLALAQFSVYLKSMMASEGIDGVLNTDLTIRGAMDNPEDVVISGNTELSDFLLKDDKGNPVFENALFGVYLDSVDLQNSYYGVRKVLMSAPQVHAELYENTSNFEQLLQPMMEAAEAADTLPEQTDEAEPDTTVEDSIFFRVDTVLLEKGAVYLADHSLNRAFKYSVTSINTLVTDVDPVSDNIPVNYSLILNKDGKFSGDAQFSIANAAVFNYNGVLEGMDLTSFSPYSEYYVARPVKSGYMTFDGSAKMTETKFKAQNKISINDIEMGEKTADSAIVNVPVGLALGILKDKNGDVKIDVPMEGDPSDPDFSIGKIVAKTLTDFVIKVASSPFAIVGDIAGVNPERLEEMPLEFARFELSEDNKKTLNQIAIALEKKPELRFRFTLEVPTTLAEEALAIHHVKRDYLQGTEGKNAYKDKEELEDAIKKLKNNNEALEAYVLQKTDMPQDSGLAKQCVDIIGLENVKQGVLTLIEKRHQTIKDYLFNTLKVDESSIVVRNADIFNQRMEVEKPRYRVEVSVK